MSTATTPNSIPISTGPLVTRDRSPSLEPGDHLTRAEFERRYADVPALLAGNISQVLAVLQQGIGTSEHAAFVQRLAAAGNQ